MYPRGPNDKTGPEKAQFKGRRFETPPKQPDPPDLSTVILKKEIYQ
jgi:hypothetical protein